jgi:ankyrin repeat protein
MVQYLLDNGADPTIRDNDQKSSMDRAIKGGDSGILAILKKH